MGRLESTASAKQHWLGTQEVIGRSRECTLRINEQSVSGMHASLRWTGHGWVLRDAGSRNGTFVDGTRIDAGAAVRVDRGSEVQFGRSEPWRLVLAGPPVARAVDADTGDTRTMDGGLLELGDTETSSNLVFDGGTQTYWVEGPTLCYQVDDGEVVVEADRRWVLRLPEPVQPTTAGETDPDLAEVQAEFRVSADEEHVSVTLRTGSRRWDLPTKAHHYTLVTLARHRVADGRLGVSGSEAGWIDRHALLAELKIGENLLYTHLFRARKELRTLGITSAIGLIERRQGAGQLRIGIRDLTVRTA